MLPATAAFALWNWCVADRIDQTHVRAALSAVIRRPVVTLDDAPAAVPGAVLCDVWHTGGDFPTAVDCYLAPAQLSEPAAAAALANRLRAACLLPDDTLNPTRHLLAAADGTLRPAHVDIAGTDAGEVRTNLRFCTVTDPWCREWQDCRASRWGPDSVAPAA